MFKKNLIKCNDCPVMLDKNTASTVKRVLGDFSFDSSEYYDYYCPTHAKKYDILLDSYSIHGIRYFKTIPEHNIEVDVNGKEINKSEK